MRSKHRARIISLLAAACASFAEGAAMAAVTDITWTGSTSNTFGTSTNWSPNTAPGPTTDVFFTGAPSGFSNDAPDLATSVGVNGVVFGAGGWTISGTTLKLIGGSDSGGSTGGDGMVVNSTGALLGTDTIATGLQLGTSSNSTDNGTYIFNVADGNTLALSNVTAYSGNSCKVSFDGNDTGILLLQGSSNNTFSDLSASGGTLELDKTAGFNATAGKLIVYDSATALYQASNQVPTTFRLGDSAVVNLNGFNQSLTAIQFSTNPGGTAENGAGTIDLNGGTLTVSSGTAISTIATTTGVTETTALIDGNGNASSALAIGGNSTFTANAGNTAIGLNINAPITGGTGNTLTIAGAGAIEFSGSNTYAATTSITTGTLVLNNAAALGGDGTLDLHGGKLENQTGSTLSLANNVTLSANSQIIGNAGVSFTGNFTTNLASSTLNNNLTAGNLTLGGPTAGSGNVYLSESAATSRNLTLAGNGNTIINAVIADSSGGPTPSPGGGLIIGNTSTSPTVTLNASNTYTGTTTVTTNGTLVLGNDNALGGGGTIKLNGGNLQNGTGSLITLGNPVTLNAGSIISGAAGVTLSGTLTNTNGNQVLSNNLTAATLTIGGASVGSGNVYLSESATTGRTMTLAGSGTTVVNAVIADFNGAGAPGQLAIGAANAAPDVTLNAVNTYSGGTTVNNGLLIVSAGLNGSAGSLSGGLGSGVVSINGGAAILRNTPASTVFGLIQSGYNGGGWNGPGINSPSAAANAQHLTAVGMYQPTAASTFDAQPLNPADVAVMYTYYGDANLDGQVDASDYSLIDNGYLNSLTGWQNGDFNYDGVINGSDYTLIDNAFNMQGPQLGGASPDAIVSDEIASSSPVPEPVGLSLIALAAGALTRSGAGRRRRCE